MSHPHADRINGFHRFLQKCEVEGIPIRVVLQSGVFHETEHFLRLQKYLIESEILTLSVRAGTEIDCKNRVMLHILGPPEKLITETSSDIKNASLVALVKYGQSKLLFSGDAEFPSWSYAYVTQKKWLKAQVLKIPHYGSKYGTCLELLETVNPKYAIISGPEDSERNWPHPIVEWSLAAILGITTYHTAKHGNIVIESNAKGEHTILTEKPSSGG